MSSYFGQIRQIAFVVRDIDQAIHYWTETLGIGPFFTMRRVTPENFRSTGCKIDMQQTLQQFPMQLTSVREYAQRVMAVQPANL